jgi:protein involved in polysaccharide export with SLBB domain
MKKIAAWLLIAPLALAAQAPQITPATGAAQTQPSQTTGIPGLPDANYALGPGDSIRVSAFTGNEYLEQTITLAEDGNIFIPFSVNKLVDVRGKTPSQVRDLIQTEMRQTFLNPVVQVLTSSLGSKRAILIGEISGGGAFPISGNETLLDVIASHGGFSQRANLAEVQITHAGGKRVSVNLYDYILRNETNLPIPKIEPGDVIYVPSTETVSNKYFLVGEFRTPGVIQSQEKLKLIEVVQKAGLTNFANTKQIFLIRSKGAGNTDITEIAYSDLYKKGNFSVDVPLETGDVLYAPKNRVGRLTEVTAALAPITSLISTFLVFGTITGSGTTATAPTK